MIEHCSHFGGLTADGHCSECGLKFTIGPIPGTSFIIDSANPKTLTGAKKVPMLSVVPPASLIGEAEAMRYGAYEAPRVDGTKGYGPYNWRDQAIEAMTYIDAAMRHLMQWVDGEELDQQSGVHHLKHAKATIGILLDAMEHNWIDNRPSVKKLAATHCLDRGKRK